MADLKREDVLIQVNIHEMDGDREFNDSLYFSPADFAALDDADLEKMKQDRFNSWVDFVQTESAKEQPEPTEEELLLSKEVLLNSVNEIDLKLAEMDANVTIDAKVG